MQLYFEKFQNNYSNLNGWNNMPIRMIDLCRHTMQVGHKNKSSFSNASIYKHLELFFMVMANVDYQNGELVLKKQYNELDQSEKVGVSYQIGQGLAKAVAEEYFDIPWVAHFKTMKNMGYLFTPSGSVKMIIDPNVKSGKEPDLIGYDRNGNVHIFEAKGTSKNSIKNDILQKAINQVSEYTEIYANGYKENFTTRNACVFIFSPYFCGRIIDPVMDNEQDVNFIGLLQCLYNYYYNFLDNIEMQFEIITVLEQKWYGFIFSFNGENYFFGMNSLYRSFLQEEIFNEPKAFLLSNTEEDKRKVNKVLDFFSEQHSSKWFDNNDFISVGKDGCILCNLNKI